MLGPNSRAYAEDKVEAWLETRAAEREAVDALEMIGLMQEEGVIDAEHEPSEEPDQADDPEELHLDDEGSAPEVEVEVSAEPVGEADDQDDDDSLAPATQVALPVEEELLFEDDEEEPSDDD